MVAIHCASLGLNFYGIIYYTKHYRTAQSSAILHFDRNENETVSDKSTVHSMDCPVV